LKAIATVIAIGVLVIILGAVFMLVRKNPALLHR
jgi:hypothetical protein